MPLDRTNMNQKLKFPMIALGGVLAAVAASLGLFFVSGNPYVLHVLILAMVWALFGAGWNLSFGIGGIKAFGHQAFFAISAYVSAILSLRLGLSPWLTIFIGALVAAALSVVVVAPVLRLRSAPQIAIVTLAFGEIARILIVNFKGLTNGEMGLAGIPTLPSLNLLGTKVNFSSSEKLGYAIVIALMLVLVLTVTQMFRRSRFGMAMTAVRDAQDAAASLGLNPTTYRVCIFVASALVVGLAGGFYAHYLQVLTPSDTSSVVLMVMVISMVITGGLGTLLGPVVGALLISGALEYFRAFEDYRLVIYGVAVVLIIRFMPDGVAPLFGRAAERLLRLRGSTGNGGAVPSKRDAPVQVAE